jgi:hypothetical protein
MDVDVDVELAPGAVRCAAWAVDVGVEPVGTAPAPAGWVLVDWPLPWPRDASMVDGLERVHACADARGYRVQLTVPRPDCVDVSVVVHDRPTPDGWFSGLVRRARTTAVADLVDVACELLDDPAGGIEPAAEPAGEVLVCSHGARDRCCGSLGTNVAIESTAMGLGVRRTSHLGGHRFAPTAVVLPAGTAWAYLDAATLTGVARRSVPLADVLDRYRGSLGFAPGAAQAAEREAFRAVGWEWLDWRRRAVDLGDGLMRVEGIAPGGSARAWEVTTEPGRALPIPECGLPIDAAKKAEVETRVVAVRALSS